MSELASKTQRILIGEPLTRDLEIDVIEENGVITLKGEVPTEEIRKAAEAYAMNVFGVRGVINELEVTTDQ